MSQALSDIYHAFDNTLNVIPAPADGSLQSLVTFDDARTEPVHRWYAFKEGFSFNLLPWLCDEKIIRERTTLRLLDPYMGVATTLLAAQLRQSQLGATAIGVERNPAIRAIAHAKIQWPQYRVSRIQHLIDLLIEDDGQKGAFGPFCHFCHAILAVEISS